MEKSKSDPAVRQRAEQVRAEIEREAETKRNAILAVLGTDDVNGVSSTIKPVTRAPKQATTA